MRSWLKTTAAIVVAAIAVALFRSLFFAIYTVDGNRLEPTFVAGDRVLVNRWSYGLRSGTFHGLFGYGRLLTDSVRRGDLVAIDNPLDRGGGVYVCRCSALPGDTVSTPSGPTIVPGRRATCAEVDHYWMQSVNAADTADSRLFGAVAEYNVIGRVVLVVYSHDDSKPFYTGFRRERTLTLAE